jgi:hypothetical protein
VLVEDRTYFTAWLSPELNQNNLTRREAFKMVYGKLLGDGISCFYYIEGDVPIGMDTDGTNDGSPCNDLGASWMTAKLKPISRWILGGFDVCLSGR